MEVKANKNVDLAQRPVLSQVKPRPATANFDTVSFSRVVALEQAMHQTPALRPEAVQRARALVSDAEYPPTATIDGIATLLALEINAGESNS